MEPQVRKLLGRTKLLRIRYKETLEHIGDMPDIELVMEVCGCLAELLTDRGVQSESGLLYVCVARYRGFVRFITIS